MRTLSARQCKPPIQSVIVLRNILRDRVIIIILCGLLVHLIGHHVTVMCEYENRSMCRLHKAANFCLFSGLYAFAQEGVSRCMKNEYRGSFMVITDLEHKQLAYLCVLHSSMAMHVTCTDQKRSLKILGAFYGGWCCVFVITRRAQRFLPRKGFICSLQEDHHVVLKVLIYEYIRFLHLQWQHCVRHSESLHFPTQYICVPFDSHNKEQLSSKTALISLCLQWRRFVFTVTQELVFVIYMKFRPREGG